MKVIQFFVIGESGVGKSTLVDTYLWKLHFGYAYHDHLMDHRRYHIQLKEIAIIQQLDNAVHKNNYDISIYFVCFKVTDQKSMETARRKWVPEIRRNDQQSKVFLVGLQGDLRHRFLSKLRYNLVRRSEILKLCRYYENLDYLECSSFEVQSVQGVFESALRAVLYNVREAEMRIVNMYNLTRNKFKFDEADKVINEIKN